MGSQYNNTHIMCLTKATKPRGCKWTKGEMAEYVRGYTHDAKQARIRQEDYGRVVRRLSSYTGWKVREVREWLAGSMFKACESNPMTGTRQVRAETKQVAPGGAEGQRVRALRAMRAELTGRVAGTPEMVVTVAMVQELEDNKREVCSQGRRAVRAAILMAAEEQGMHVEVFDGGARGMAVHRVAEAHQWAVTARWVREAEAAAVLERWRSLAIRSPVLRGTGHHDRDGGGVGRGHRGIHGGIRQGGWDRQQ